MKEEEEEVVCAHVGESSGLGSVGCEEHLGENLRVRSDLEAQESLPLSKL